MFGLRVALGTKKSSNLPAIYQVTYQQIKKYIYLPAIFEKEIKNPNYQNRTSCLNQEIKSSISTQNHTGKGKLFFSQRKVF